MSGISSIGGYGVTISLADVLNEESKKSSITSYFERLSARNSYSSSTTESAGASAEIVQAALQRAVKELSEKEGQITFTKIASYRQELEDAFTKDLRAGLEKAGLPKGTVFTLKLTTKGNIEVQCDNEESKVVIEEYLAKKRKTCETFGYIQALGNLERADRQAGSFGLTSLSKARAEIQATAVEAFFNTSLQSGFTPSSLLAAFGEDESAAFYSGVSALV